MKSTKKKQSNSDKLNSLASVFKKTVAAERQKAIDQIHDARHEVLNSELPPVPEVPVAVPLPVKPEALHPQLTPEPVAPASVVITPQVASQVASDEGEGREVSPTRLSAYFLPIDISKLEQVRLYLVQNGVNLSITDGQLMRLAVRKLVLSEDLVGLYRQIHAEDGRKHRYKKAK